MNTAIRNNMAPMCDLLLLSSVPDPETVPQCVFGMKHQRDNDGRLPLWVFFCLLGVATSQVNPGQTGKAMILISVPQTCWFGCVGAPVPERLWSRSCSVWSPLSGFWPLSALFALLQLSTVLVCG